MSWVEEAKRRAAEAAAQHVESGTVIGLGTGSTAKHIIRIIGSSLSAGTLTDVMGIPTSNQTAAEAEKAGVPLATLDEYPELDIGIDGADQIDVKLDVVKGGGGALLREKIVASACKTYIIIADDRKLTDRLGDGFPLPIEVLPFSGTPARMRVTALGASVKLRLKDKSEPFVTDNGNHILDADFRGIGDPGWLEAELKAIPGVLETGLFLGYADIAYVGGMDGVRRMERPR